VSAPQAELKFLLDREGRRTSRSGRPFTLLRIAPPAYAGREALDGLRELVETTLRNTDVVREFASEVFAMLIDTAGHHAPAAVERLEKGFHKARLGYEPRIAWASIGAGHEPCWEKAWGLAGALLVARAAAA
jgi:hypothetical protein